MLDKFEEHIYWQYHWSLPKGLLVLGLTYTVFHGESCYFLGGFAIHSHTCTHAVYQDGFSESVFSSWRKRHISFHTAYIETAVCVHHCVF